MSDPLTGPAPVWREGYYGDEPIYRETVRALGIPAAAPPTGGEVVPGEWDDAFPDQALSQHYEENPPVNLKRGEISG